MDSLPEFLPGQARTRALAGTDSRPAGTQGAAPTTHTIPLLKITRRGQ